MYHYLLIYYEISKPRSGILFEYKIKAQRCGFDFERKKEPADMELSRLFRKPRKRNGAGFF